MQIVGQAGILKKKNGANKDTVITSEDWKLAYTCSKEKQMSNS